MATSDHLKFGETSTQAKRALNAETGLVEPAAPNGWTVTQKRSQPRPPERRAILNLRGGAALHCVQWPPAGSYVLLVLPWLSSEPRYPDFTELLSVAPGLVLPVLREAVAHLEEIVADAVPPGPGADDREDDACDDDEDGAYDADDDYGDDFYDETRGDNGTAS